MPMNRSTLFSGALVVAAATMLVVASHSGVPKRPLLIVNAQIADGTGAPLHKGSVRVSFGRIVDVGALTPEKDETVIDAKGLVLAPGFIDIHNHSTDELGNDPQAETQVSQGITSLIVGADGDSPWPLIAWVRNLQQHPAAVNVGVFAGHATIREQVMQKDFRRVATAEEIRKMESDLGQALNQQAMGLSSGLEYEVGNYSEMKELVALAKVAAERGGIYMTHIRDEGDLAFEALREEIAIGEQAHIGIEHSHIKLATTPVWGKANAYIKIIEDARTRGVDFLADCYPYLAWHSNIKLLVPNKKYTDAASVKQGLDEVGGASHVTITEFAANRAYEGHTLAELAKNAQVSDVELFMRVVREGDQAGGEAEIICESMTEGDLKAFYQQPWVMVASDGGIRSAHPRGAGTFPRVLGLYVREKHWLSLTEAIRKMTSLPAKRLNWSDRGVIREGAYADLVLFNPDTVIDRATFRDPFAIATGIERVFVNGTEVWSDGKATGQTPGFVIGRKGAVSELLD